MKLPRIVQVFWVWWPAASWLHRNPGTLCVSAGSDTRRFIGGLRQNKRGFWGMRAVLTARECIVRMCTTMISQSPGLAKTFGPTLAEGKGQAFDRSVRRACQMMLPCAICSKGCWRCCPASRICGAPDRQLARFAREDAACRIVSSAPGVGTATVIAFVTTVDDPARFQTACDVGAYPGLTPKRYQPGDVNIGGRLSKAGDRLTRKLLFEAATAILYRTLPLIALRQWGLRLSAHSESGKARVALARKLLTIRKTNSMF